MAYKVILLDKKEKKNLVLSWQGDEYCNFLAELDGQPLFRADKIEKNKNYEFALPDSGKIELKLSSSIIHAGIEVLKNGEHLRGTIRDPLRIVNLSFCLLMIIAIGDIISGALIPLGIDFGSTFHIQTHYLLPIIEGLVLMALTLLFRFNLSKIFLSLASVFILFDITANAKLLEFREQFINTFFGLVINILFFIFIVRAFKALNSIKKNKKRITVFKLYALFTLPFALIFGVGCYFTDYSFFYKITYTDEDYANLGGNSGYADGLNNQSLCRGCDSRFINNGTYLEYYYQGYYDGCLENNNGCEQNLPLDVLKAIKGYRSETEPENLS